MRCSCGKELTEEEIKHNRDIARASHTSEVKMCSDCWHNYVNHAITGN